jgi:translation initiation factor IF-2
VEEVKVILGVRIFSLAKELNMTSKELMAYLETQGHPVKNHMCTIPDTVAQILRDRLPKRQAKVVKPKPSGNGGPGQAAAPAAGARAPGSPPTTTSKPSSILGKAKPVSPPAAASSARPAAAAAPPPAPELAEEESAEKGEKGEKRPKPKDQHPTRKRVFPGSPDFGMDVMGTRLAGTRRGIRRLEPARPGHAGAPGAATAVEPREIAVATPITVKDLSAAIGVKAGAIIGSLLRQGQMITMNSYLSEELVLKIAEENQVKITIKKEQDIEEEIKALESKTSSPEDLKPRAPVVTFMGHVDHGKTSLLDKIRQTKVTQGEAGGITQHIGAYRVDKDDIHVVFVDTPGHKAFTEMRARGANVTDLVVLVVAADDGPMPQTEEALNHARAADVPIIVALNKIDRPNANPGRAKDLLAKLGLIPVEWAGGAEGSTEYVEVSALTGLGIDDLLETINLESQILDLKADPTKPAMGTVLEAESNEGRGILTTVLIQDGTLRTGDYVLCGQAHGRVRGMWLNGVQQISEASPSTPVQISGLSEVPEVGDKLYVMSDSQAARKIAEERHRKRRETDRAERQKVTLENLFESIEAGAVKELRIVLKADVMGSLEVLKKALPDLGTEEVKVKVLHSGVGGISQDDVELAVASKGVVVGFQVVPDERARALAEDKSVEIRIYQVIYELLDEVRKALEDKLAPTRREQVKGHLVIQQIFRASKVGAIAGCRVTDGTVARTDKIRLIRDGRIIFTGELSSLRRVKDDVREVKEGFECGLKIANYEDIKEGDVVESFAIVEEKRSL